jgi:NMD protein affecting ribosome stability and mRNA decay
MAKYSKQQISEQTQNEADKIARQIQRPGQTKEQTRLISQGIQKGIDLYKKQQKAKARELDRKLKKVSALTQSDTLEAAPTEIETNNIQWLPWGLLLLSWIGFGVVWYGLGKM